MTVSTNQLRTEVRDLLLEFDQSFPPHDRHAADASRHAYRLRFALARVEELEHAAIMQSALYNAERLDVANAILRLDIDRARAFLRSTAMSAAHVTLEVAEREPVEHAA
jgi:hypothetical protein